MSARKAPSKVIPSKLSKSSLSSTSTIESLKSSLSSLSTIENFAGKNYEQLASNWFSKRTHLWNRTISLSSESNTTIENNYINEYLATLKGQIKLLKSKVLFLREDLREKNVHLK